MFSRFMFSALCFLSSYWLSSFYITPGLAFLPFKFYFFFSSITFCDASFVLSLFFLIVSDINKVLVPSLSDGIFFEHLLYTRQGQQDPIHVLKKGDIFVA